MRCRLRPDHSSGIVEAQLSGSVVAGLTAALYGEITIEKGRVKQANFNDYQMLRIVEMPDIDVHIVTNHEEPGGVGEPAVPPLAAAVANAIFALTGKRVRKLPIRLVTLAWRWTMIATYRDADQRDSR